jgi:transcriptional regulator with XRE-family HTH domain
MVLIVPSIIFRTIFIFFSGGTFMSLGKRIKERRLEKGLTQEDVAKKLGMGRSNLGHIERGRTKPSAEVLNQIASILDTTTDYLLGRSEKKEETFNPELTEKDERDIKKELQKMIDGLNNKGSYAAFDGQTLDDMDDEDRELLIASLENSLRLAKRIAKQKFTPNKYRK